VDTQGLDYSNNTLLHIAVMNDETKLIQLLLKLPEIDVNVQNEVRNIMNPLCLYL
jgi:ankyrin repeat protein